MINIMGLGYTGHPTALMMASHGVEAGIKSTMEFQETDVYAAPVGQKRGALRGEVDHIL